MAPKNCSSYALFFILNILFFSFASACDKCPKPKLPQHKSPPPKPTPCPPTPSPPPPPKPEPTPCPPSPHPHPMLTSTPSHPHPKPNHSQAPKSCPRDTLKLGMCTSALNGMWKFSFGVPKTPCCSFFNGLADFDAAFCLCTALKGNVVGVPFDIPISFSYLLNFCSRQAPVGFMCLND